VADEVRALALRTRDSTSQISEVVNRFQKTTHTVVDRMKKSRSSTDSCVSQSTHAGEILTSMSKMAVEVRSMSEQIAVAIEEHSGVVVHIRQNVGDIDSMAEQSEGSARRTATTASELNRLTLELDGLIRKFKV
jgi:methyl-accepting chemotaxis protein